MRFSGKAGCRGYARERGWLEFNGLGQVAAVCFATVCAFPGCGQVLASDSVFASSAGRCASFTIGETQLSCDRVTYLSIPGSSRGSFLVKTGSGLLSFSGGTDIQPEPQTYLLKIDSLIRSDNNGTTQRIEASGVCKLNVSKDGTVFHHLVCNVNSSVGRVAVDFKSDGHPVAVTRVPTQTTNQIDGTGVDARRDELCGEAFRGTQADQSKIGLGMNSDQQTCWRACRMSPKDFNCKFARVESGRLKMRNDVLLDQILDPVERRDDVMRKLSVLQFRFLDGRIQFSVRNESDYLVKDIQFLCNFTAPSGTIVRAERYTAYYSVPAHTPSQPVWAKLGHIDRDANQSRCSISAATIAD